MDILFRELKTHSFKNIQVYYVSDTSGILKWGLLVGEVCLACAIRGCITCRLKKLIKLACFLLLTMGSQIYTELID